MGDRMRKFLLASVATLGMVAGISGAAHAQAAKPPAPGTFVVHLNGLLNDQINDIGSTANTVNTSSGAYKLNPIGMAGFLRLYPGFDAQTEGGFQYGVAAELRTGFTTAGTGNQEFNTSGPHDSLTIRRAYAYFGSKNAGFVHIGQDDGVWWLLSTGEYYDYGDGNLWNSDGGVGSSVPSQTHPSGLFSSSGALYSTNKIVYISPDIGGLKAGIDFEPNSNGFKEGELCTGGSSACGTLASAPGGAGAFRRKNTFDGGIEYTGEFSGMGVKLAADYMLSSPIGNSSGSALYTIVSPQTGSITHETSYKRMGVTQLSGQVSYAGFVLGANVKDGQVNNGYSFLLPGQRSLLFYEVTGVYTAGPYTLGMQYFNNQSAGAHLPGNGTARTETDYGFDIGANYALTPHFGIYAVYLYGHRHQLGYDFIAPKTGSTAFNNVQAQAISAGAQLKW